MAVHAGKITKGLVPSLPQLAAMEIGKFRGEILCMELVSIWRRILKNGGGGGEGPDLTPDEMTMSPMIPGRRKQRK